MKRRVSQADGGRGEGCERADESEARTASDGDEGGPACVLQYGINSSRNHLGLLLSPDFSADLEIELPTLGRRNF